MTFTHVNRREYEDSEGDKYWMNEEDSLTVEAGEGKIYINMYHDSNYRVRTFISFSKDEAKELVKELNRLIGES